jgi:hypothetical protein
MSEEELIEAVQMIDSALQTDKISERIYLPGGKKFFL